MSPQIFWIKLDELNFDSNQPVQKLTIHENYSLMGDVSKEFKPNKMFDFLKPED
ncbi:hypothetical protein [Thalassoglobus neptunius]|uniref:hypothetical protein n=1 Tax=Thalassoglobus neptunius TaxID=1938619 RepID=UPI0018D21DEC|nr:hypothetical protein [Thalassoglobus neptunius]